MVAAGNDSINAGEGDNEVYGGLGDDTITAGAKTIQYLGARQMTTPALMEAIPDIHAGRQWS